MLAALVRFSVHYRGVVLVLAGLLLAYGGLALSRAGLDIFPEFSPKLVIIQTESPGLSAEQVEVLVTQPIENALGGLVGLQSLRSESIQGLSIVNVIFEEDTDLYRNRQLVAERLATLGDVLPEGVPAPVMVPLASSSATVRTLGVTSERLSLMELRDLADWTLTPRLLAVPGVADVNVFGGEVRQLQIQVRPEALARHGLSLAELTEAARQATGMRGAGFIENENQRLTLRTTGQPIRPEALAEVVLARRDGVNVTFGDVADIRVAPEPPFSAAQVMGRDGVVMMVIGQYGANTLTVSRGIDDSLAPLVESLAKEGITLHGDLFIPANYILASVRNISGHLMLGGAFVVVVLFLFLFDVRTAFISAVAIPLSLLAAVIVLLETGARLNVMVIGGLAIALGEVVDDAIIDTENIFRRLRENRLLPVPRPLTEVVFEASMEVRGSVVYATFIVALVFVPLLTLGGVAGRMFAPLGFTYILAILMSLVVALTVTPALCYWLLGRAQLSDRDPPLIRWMKPAYGAAVRGIGRVPLTALALSLACCALVLWQLPGLGGRFLPELREGHFIVHTTSVPGTSLQESIRVGKQLTQAFLDIPGVRSVSQWAGRAERGADTYGSHYSEFEVDLEPLSGPEQQRVLDALRERLGSFPGILFEANSFLIERVDETISGYTSPVVVNLYGAKLDALDRAAQAVAGVMREVPGATDVQVRSPPGTPVLQVRLRLDRMASLGLRPVEVLEAVQTAFEGRVVGKTHVGNRVHDVAVVLAGRSRPGQVRALPLRTPEGTFVTLGEVADVQQVSGRYNILHEGGRRIQTVTCSVEGRDYDSFMRELQQRVADDVRFDADTYPVYTGAAVEQARSRERLLLQSVVAGVGVLLLIQVALGSLRHVLLVLVNLPFSLIGGVLAVLWTGGMLSVGSMVGFVTLFGITVRNSIMLVSHYNHLVEREGRPWNLDTAVRGAQERLPSILMTALVTALAMLPIAIGSDNPGREIMGPMAAIIVGGLLSSTLLNLLLLPAIMLRFGRFERPAGGAA